jgi:hypothetical protein
LDHLLSVSLSPNTQYTQLRVKRSTHKPLLAMFAVGGDANPSSATARRATLSDIETAQVAVGGSKQKRGSVSGVIVCLFVCCVVLCL